ncbi:hypothetical protein WOLCODRAFT_150832 [Wolfiporia cocos MD-104 SS10]|uniref:DH domain-containing protein n=1 Tax=Wolfiporia cocos (strain MD-104) TaxID=742152 RepID=A0A2H3JFW9_WOLCO|nr:hypothetical protein WOLCODRAFT_150832 [Wolfiporia cocos MD-104 SS10]
MLIQVQSPQYSECFDAPPIQPLSQLCTPHALSRVGGGERNRDHDRAVVFRTNDPSSPERVSGGTARERPADVARKTTSAACGPGRGRAGKLKRHSQIDAGAHCRRCVNEKKEGGMRAHGAARTPQGEAGSCEERSPRVLAANVDGGITVSGRSEARAWIAPVENGDISRSTLYPAFNTPHSRFISHSILVFSPPFPLAPSRLFVPARALFGRFLFPFPRPATFVSPSLVPIPVQRVSAAASSPRRQEPPPAMEVAVAPAATLPCAPSPSPTKAGHAHTHPRRARASTSSAGTTPSPSSPPRSALLARRVSKPELKHPLFALPAAPSPPYPSLSSSYSSSALSLLYTSAAGDPHAHASLGMSPATATGTVRAPRVPPFVPLTPIMASPRLTPEIGARTRGADRAPEEGVEADYLNRGGAHAVLLPLRHSLSCDSAEASGRAAAAAMPSPPLPSFAPPPTWTSTPPTPPAKHASELPGPLGSRNSSRGRSTKGPRPASVAVVPTASAIASLTYTSSSSTSLASSVTVRGRLPFPPSAGDAKTGPRSRRRMSLPPSLAERMPAPQPPLTGTAASSPVRVGRELRDWERAASPLRAAVVRERGSVRKLFTVGDADGSEGEEVQPSTVRGRSGSVGTRRSRASSRREQAVASETQEQAEGEVCRDSEDEPEEEEEEEEEDTEREVKLGDEAAREREVEDLRRANAATEADVERLRVRTRRYHALMELLATEAGYLTDLRALVTVYLEQLPMLSTTTPPSPAMRPSLALVRSLPSSRSSFLHPSPVPSPSPSAGSHLGSESGHGPPKEKDKDKGRERERSGDKKGDKDKAKVKEYGLRKSKGKDKGKGRDVGLEYDVERDKDKDIGANADHEEAVEDVGRAAHAHEPQQHRRGTLDAEPVSHGHAAAKGKHARRAILLDGDVRAVCRNARELLEFHERLVEELHGVVAPYGLSSMFDAHGRDGKAPGGADEIPEESTLEHVDDAVSVVAEMFVSQAPSFSIYEAFCAGHNEAADLVRRIQEVYSVEWDAYEQRCSLLIAHAFDLDAQRASPESRSEGHGMTLGDNGGLPASATTSSQLSPRLVETMRKKRRHSTSSLAMLSSPPLFDNMPHMVPGARSDPTEGEHSSSSSAHGHGRTSSQAHAQATRLKLLDYLIKPVQRICEGWQEGTRAVWWLTKPAYRMKST